jgi:hypothetical protein
MTDKQILIFAGCLYMGIMVGQLLCQIIIVIVEKRKKK